MNKEKKVYWVNDEFYVKGYNCEFVITDLWSYITNAVYRFSGLVRIWDVFQSNDEVWVKLQYLNVTSEKHKKEIKDKIVEYIDYFYED